MTGSQFGFVLGANDAMSRLAAARKALGGSRPGGVSMFDPLVISFAHGEGLRRPHPSVIAAGVRALLDTSTSSLEDYMFLKDCQELQEAILCCMLAEGQSEPSTANIVIDAGSTRLAFAALMTLTRPDDCVLTAPGYYHPLNGWVRLSRLTLGVSIQDDLNPGVLTANVLDRWQLEISHGRLPIPRILFLFNPTMLGSIYTENDLEAVGAYAQRWGAVVLEDRAFARTVFPGKAAGVSYRTFASVVPDVDSLCLHSVTKAECLANIRLGWACGHGALIEPLRDFTTATAASIPRFSQLMAAAALRAPRSFIEDNALESEARSRLVLDIIANATGEAYQVEPLVAPVAGHSVYLRIRRFDRYRAARLKRSETPVSSINICEELLDRNRVAISPGFSSGFDGPIFRLSFGCLGHDAIADRGLDRELAAAAAYLGSRLGSAWALIDPPVDRLGRRADYGAGEWGMPGRELIRSGLEERLLPGIDRLFGVRMGSVR